MKKTGLILILVLTSFYSGLGQIENEPGIKILLQGTVRDASTFSPLPNSQIFINRVFTYVTDTDGAFSFRITRRDTATFRLLGYKPARFCVSDTLSGQEFMVGIYLKTDTVSIGEVIILPRLPNLKSDILNKPVSTSPEMENAKYNMALSAYQGRVALSKLGDPASNYSIIQQRQRTTAFEKGGIPSDRIAGLSPLLLIPAVYLLLNGFPEKPAPMKSDLTRQELEQLNKKYLELTRKK